MAKQPASPAKQSTKEVYINPLTESPQQKQTSHFYFATGKSVAGTQKERTQQNDREPNKQWHDEVYEDINASTYGCVCNFVKCIVWYLCSNEFACFDSNYCYNIAFSWRYDKEKRTRSYRVS